MVKKSLIIIFVMLSIFGIAVAEPTINQSIYIYRQELIRDSFRWYDKLSDPVTLFTLCLVFVGFLQYWVYKKQYESFKIKERAYVRMNHLEPGIKWFEDCGIVLMFSIKNVGNTPADVTDILVKPVVLGAGKSLESVPVYQRQRSVMSFHTILYNEDSFSYSNPELLNLGDKKIKDAIDLGEKDLYIVGYVDYSDKFGGKYRSGYARKYSPGLNKEGKDNLVFINQDGYNYDRKV
jgi:hypothetical protein